MITCKNCTHYGVCEVDGDPIDCEFFLRKSIDKAKIGKNRGKWRK